MLRGKCIALNVRIKREERLNINDLSFYFKEVGKEQQNNLKKSTSKEITEMSGYVNGKKKADILQRKSTVKSWFFEKITL